MGSGTEQTRAPTSEVGGKLILVVVDKCPGASVELEINKTPLAPRLSPPRRAYATKILTIPLSG